MAGGNRKALPGFPSAGAAHESSPADGHEPTRIIPRRDLDVGGCQGPARHEAAADDAMGHGRCEPEKVAAEVDGDPRARAHVLERVPARGVDAGRERPAVEEGSRLIASEGGGGWIESQDDTVAQELDGNEPDDCIER